jgi:PAS domain S-box-containing protein
MTEHAQTEAPPLDESAFASALADATQSLVCVLDRDGRILLFNDECERATGFAREEVLGRDARGFVIPPAEAEAFGEVLAHVWRTGFPSPKVGHWLTRNGGRRLIAWSNKPVPGEDAAPRGTVVTAKLPLHSA